MSPEVLLTADELVALIALAGNPGGTPVRVEFDRARLLDVPENGWAVEQVARWRDGADRAEEETATMAPVADDTETSPA